MTQVIRHILAMHVPAFGRSLRIPLTLDELAAAGFPVTASMPAATRAGAAAAAIPRSPSGAAATPAVSGPPAADAGRSVAITFDDGPHPEGTPRILEILAEHGVQATFFLVGEQVVKRPELAQRIAAEGHAIGLHGHRHLPHPSRTPRQLREDFVRGTAAIADAVGAEPRLHRPPYGIYSRPSLRIARERGLQPLLWSSWGKDWRKLTTPTEITSRVMSHLRSGDVILLHDADFYSAPRSHRRTAAALPMIMKMLQSAELGTVTCA